MSDYSLQSYAQMMADAVRMQAYQRALQELVRADSVILDLGAGTGIMTLLACQYGAKKVYAVEPNPALQVASELVAENGFSDRVTFFNKSLIDVNLPEKVDLIVSDLRGRLPFYGRNLELVKYAQEKYLKTSGVILPALDRMSVALCSDAKLYQLSVVPWASREFDLKLTAYSKHLANSFYPLNINQASIASEPELWGQIDYSKIEKYSYEASVTLKPSCAEVFGFVMWFDCDLTSTVRYSCGLGAGNVVYGSAFFPFEKPLTVDSQQQVQISISANYVAGDYVWRWKTGLLAEGEIFPCFDQSNFLGLSFTPEILQSLASSEK